MGTTEGIYDEVRNHFYGIEDRRMARRYLTGLAGVVDELLVELDHSDVGADELVRQALAELAMAGRLADRLTDARRAERFQGPR